MLSTTELVQKYVGKKVLWEPLAGLKVQVETADVRRAFGRIDVLIRPLLDHGTGEAWIDSNNIELQA